MNSEHVRQLAQTVRTRRTLRRLSLRQVARRAGVSAMWLSKLERGLIAQPGVPMLRKLARALEMDPLHLMAEAGYLPGAPVGDHERGRRRGATGRARRIGTVTGSRLD